jgi:hypothetical protein
VCLANYAKGSVPGCVESVTALRLGPRWVRVTAVDYGHQWAPTVVNGPDEPQVITPPAHTAGMMHAGNSDYGPEGHPTLQVAAHKWAAGIPSTLN